MISLNKSKKNYEKKKIKMNNETKVNKNRKKTFSFQVKTHFERIKRIDFVIL